MALSASRIESAAAAVTAALAERRERSSGTSFKAALEGVELRKGEKVEVVEDKAYVEITDGRREGMYVNTSGNARHGEAFVLVRRQGTDYHVYGTGKDRQVVEIGRKAGAAPGAEPEAPAAEATTPVTGRPFAEITSGPREGMYVNTSGNDRDGQAFVIARKHGVEYHIYGRGSDRLVVALKHRPDEAATPAEAVTGGRQSPAAAVSGGTQSPSTAVSG